jgi:hypothetical protein
MSSKSNAGKYAVLAALLVLALAALACSLPGTSPEATQAPQATTAGGQAQATAVPAEATAATKPTAKPTESVPEAMPTIVGLDKLDSYRQSIAIRTEEDGKQVSVVNMVEEWVREPPAKHLTMNLGELAIETITIGDKNWVKFGDTWTESATASDDMSSSLSDFNYNEGDLSYVGSESVNGVNCKHYTFDQSTDVDGKMTHVTGDVWIADESGIPTITVRMRATIDGAIFTMPGAATPTAPEKTKTYMELDVTDINQPIEINPPEM